MNGIPKGTPTQPRAATLPQTRCRDWPAPLAAELLALHRRAIGRGWRAEDYRAISACLLRYGRAPAGHRWCALADRLAAAEGVEL